MALFCGGPVALATLPVNSVNLLPPRVKRSSSCPSSNEFTITTVTKRRTHFEAPAAGLAGGSTPVHKPAAAGEVIKPALAHLGSTKLLGEPSLPAAPATVAQVSGQISPGPSSAALATLELRGTVMSDALCGKPAPAEVRIPFEPSSASERRARIAYSLAGNPWAAKMVLSLAEHKVIEVVRTSATGPFSSSPSCVELA